MKPERRVRAIRLVIRIKPLLTADMTAYLENPRKAIVNLI